MALIEIKDFGRKAFSLPSYNTSFRERKLIIQLTLSKGEFKDGEGNSYRISDLAMTCKVDKVGPPDFGKASATIYGLPLEVMEQLSTLNMHPLFVKRNYMNIFAGDDISGYTQIFAGSITKASADFNGAPDVPFHIDARLGFFGSVTAQGDNVVSGSQPVAKFIESQAKKAGMTFKNEGVTTSIQNSIFTGSPIEQARQAAQQIGAELIIDDEQMILVKNGASRKGNVPVLSADSGLLGYPTMTQNGIECKAIFNPDFRFAGLIEIKSIVPKVSGQWRIIKLSHSLSSNMPNAGQWESSITAYYPNLSGAVGKFI